MIKIVEKTSATIGIKSDNNDDEGDHLPLAQSIENIS